MKSARKPKDSLQISVSEEKGIRYLHFGTEWVQGAMRINKPYKLELDYARHMMSWLLFAPPPQQLLQIGLGAGSLTKFVHRYLPETHQTIVEKSPAVVQVARSQFNCPPDDDRLDTLIDDGELFVTQPRLRKAFEVALVDVFDASARGPVLDSTEFYQACRNVLVPGGVMVVNLFGEVPSYGRNFANICEAFDSRVLVLPPIEAGNVIVLAFRDQAVDAPENPRWRWPELRLRADTIDERYGLNAHGWVNGLKTTTEQKLSRELIGA